MPTVKVDALKSSLTTVLNRGTRYESDYDQAIRDALSWLEENYTFKYMEVIDESLTLTVGNRDVTLPLRPKAIQSFHYSNDGAWVPKGEYGLPRVEPWQVSSVEDGPPNGYFIAAQKTLRVDNRADKAYTLRIVGDYYSDSSAILDENLPILDNHNLLLKAAAILQLNLVVKSQRLEEFWAAQLQLSLHSALGADSELRTAGKRSVRNPYPGVEDLTSVDD